MNLRALAAYMLVFTIGAIGGDLLRGGLPFVRERLAGRLAAGAFAVGMVWLVRRWRSARA